MFFENYKVQGVGPLLAKGGSELFKIITQEYDLGNSYVWYKELNKKIR